MRALLLCACAAFDYKSISINAPRRIVTQDDIDAKFEEVDKPYALYPVDGPAEEGLCVLAEISLKRLASPGNEIIVELLDDQAEPFAAVSTALLVSVLASKFSFRIDIDMRAALLPEFGDLSRARRAPAASPSAGGRRQLVRMHRRMRALQRSRTRSRRPRDWHAVVARNATPSPIGRPTKTR